MMPNNHARVVFASLAALALAAVLMPALAAPEKTPMADGWKELDRLIAEDKVQEGLAMAERLHRQAQAAGNVEDETRALIRRVQLETALSGFGTAITMLQAEPWPDHSDSRVALDLVFATSLVTYERNYAWEVRQRERVVSDDKVDLERWTSSQILAAAQRSLARLWSERESWASRGLGTLAEYVYPGTYPAEIRGTLRDVVAYSWVEQLADTATWSPSQQATWSLDRDDLVAGAPTTDPTAPGVHPLVQMAAILGELERWHTSAGRPEAALEAFLERLRRIRASLDQPADAEALTAALRSRIASTPRGLPWWSMAVAELAEVVRAEATPDALVRARDLALDGERAHPNSPGGQRCRNLIAQIEAPRYQLTAMRSDAVSKPSLAIEHANLPTLYFRALRLDAQTLLAKADDWSWLPRWQKAEALLRGRQPDAAWRVELPATADYRDHRTLVTPQLPGPGLYLVAASARSDFRDQGNQVIAVAMVVGDPVVVLASDPNGSSWEATVRSGRTGAPRNGADVLLYQLDWHKGHKLVARTTTGPDGVASFPSHGWGNSHLLLASVGGEIAIDFDGLSRLYPQQTPPDAGTLVYTDRAIYRPGQNVLWKVVAWDRELEKGTVQVAPNSGLTVTLRDANGEIVATEDVTTNSWGSASGRFTVPAGRLLGAWQVQTSRGGGAAVQVEEYKRPTFDVTVEAPKEALRLNREASLSGEARYAFGLPVATGTLRWRVTREEVAPPWWGWWWYRAPQAGPEIIASGTSQLGSDGRFETTFVPRADERRAGEKGLSWRFTLIADVTDPGGETRSGERSVRLGFVAIEGAIEAPGDWLPTDQATTIAVRRADLDGTPRAGEARWRLVALETPAQTAEPTAPPRRDRPALVEPTTPGDTKRARWEAEIRHEAVLASWPDGAEEAAGNLTHAADGRAVLNLPKLCRGAYRLYWESTDNFGATATVSRDLLVTGHHQGELPLPLLLGLEQPTVEVGGVARVLVHSGYLGQPLRLEIFRSQQRIALHELVSKGKPTVIEVPIGADARGGLTVRLSGLRDHTWMSLSRDLTVPWSDRELDVRFATFRDRLRPGTHETWRVEVVDKRGGELASAELLAAMYDRTLDQIVPYQAPRPLGLFPSRFGEAYQRTTLGMAETLWRGGHGLSTVPGYPTFQAARVVVLDRYGIGGPGRRGRYANRAMVAESMMVTDAVAPMPASAPAPMAQAKALPVNRTLGAAEEMNELRETSTAAGAAPAAPVSLRSNFAETALWAPHLVVGADGTTALEIDLPDSVTEWKVLVHALTADFRSGSVERTARTVKELQVRPSLPRFLREGDTLTAEVLVDNTGETALDTTVRIALRDPETGVDLAGAFGLDPELATGLPLRVEAGRSASLPVRLVVPARLGPVAFEATVRGGEHSDGELRPLPVLPGRMHLSQSRFAALRDTKTRTLRFADLVADDDPSRLNEQLAVTVDAQLMTSVLRALPYLVDYPYECTEQTLNRFLSTGIISRVFSQHPSLAELGRRLAADRDTIVESFDSDDPNRAMGLEETPWLRESRGGPNPDQPLLRILDPEVARAQQESSLAKLLETQTSSGGFPWFPGGPPSPWMTLYIVDGFSRALEFGVEVPKEPVVEAWQYLHRWYLDDLVRDAIGQDCCWESVTYLGYVLSAYPDESWYGAVFSTDDRRAILDFGWKHWRRHQPRLKAYLALSLSRAERTADAKLVLDSILDSSRTDEDLGTYWAREEKSWLWYADTVESHAFILRTVAELDPDDPRRDGLTQWLFLEKKLSHWKSTRATAEAIYALAWSLSRDGELGIREVVAVEAGPRRAEFVFEPEDTTTKKQLVIPGAEVVPAMGSIEVSKSTPGLAFATATWFYSTERLPTEGDGDLFGVTRRFYRRVLRGGEYHLEPLVDGARVAPGDEVEVQLDVRARHGAEYVHLRDPRPAGFEPLAVTSGWKWELGLAWYEEVRDSGTNFFFEALPTGTYTLRHRLTARQAGVFRVAPATLQSIYAPEFTAHSAGAIVEVEGR